MTIPTFADDPKGDEAATAADVARLARERDQNAAADAWLASQGVSHSDAPPAPRVVDDATPKPIHPDDVVTAPPSAPAAAPAAPRPDPYANVRWGQSSGGGGGGMVAASEAPRVGPMVLGAFDRADQSARQAATDIEADDRGQAIADQAALFDETKRMQAEQAELAAREKERAAELRARQDHADALAQEASRYGIDSNRLWANMGTGAKIGTILAISLGAFGKNNDALDMFNRAKQQDIDEQKSNIDLLGEHAKAANGLVAMAQSRFGDQRQAEQAAHIAYIEAAKVRLQQMAAADKSVEATDNYRRMMAGLDEQLAERKSQLYAYTPAHYVGGGSSGPTEKEIRKRAQDLADKAADHGVQMSPVEARKIAIEEFGGPGALGGAPVQGYQKRADNEEFGGPGALGGVEGGGERGARGGERGGERGGASVQGYQKQADKKGHGSDAENLVFNAPEGQFQARSPQSREALMKVAEKREQVDATLADYQRTVGQLGAVDKLSIHAGTPTAKAQAALSAYANASAAIRGLNNEGVWKASEKPLIDTQLPPPEKFAGHADVSAELFRRQGAKIWKARLNSEAAIPVGAGGAGAARPASPGLYKPPGS